MGGCKEGGKKDSEGKKNFWGFVFLRLPFLKTLAFPIFIAIFCFFIFYFLATSGVFLATLPIFLYISISLYLSIYLCFLASVAKVASAF